MAILNGGSDYKQKTLLCQASGKGWVRGVSYGAKLSVAKTGIAGGWNSANQSPRFTACLPFLTEDVHGIPEERMPIVERYSVAVALDFALGPNCGTRSDLSLSKQSAHATFLCRFLPMVAVMQTTEARA